MKVEHPKHDTPIIALVGDPSVDVPAHRAIPRALELASAAVGAKISGQWFPTSSIRNAARDLAGCAAVWAVPASPYANMNGALDAIRWARETGRPFLGTCGGFQHAVIEFARHVAGLSGADHAENDAHAATLVVTLLSCPLMEERGRIHFAPGSRLHRAYGRDDTTESYHCRYGISAIHRERLEQAGMHFSGHDEAGEVRALELPSHPFFIGTLFQPERVALRGEAHPLIGTFVRASLDRRGE